MNLKKFEVIWQP